MRERDYEAALKAFKKANKMKAEKCVECLWGMARAYEALGSPKKVVETCNRIVQLSADDKHLLALAYTLKGAAQYSLAGGKDKKKLREAEASFRAAMENHLEPPVVHYNLGVVLLKLDHDEEGITELKTYIATGTSSVTLREAKRIIQSPRRARENLAPAFSFTSLQGEFIDSENLLGKILFVDFWGTWCPPCRESVPSLVELNKRLSKDPVVMISVSSDSDEVNWRSFVEKNKMTWPQFLDRRNEIQEAFQVRSFPTFLVIDHEGIILYRSSGYGPGSEARIADCIKKALIAREKAGVAEKPQVAASSAPPKNEAQNPASPPPSANSPGLSVLLPEKVEKPDDKVAAKEISLATPVIEFLGVEIREMAGQKLATIRFAVRNWQEYPEELFAAQADLPPCPQGVPGSRARITVFDETGRSRSDNCSARTSRLLESVALEVAPNDTVPKQLYITIEDRRTHQAVKSNVIPIPASEK